MAIKQISVFVENKPGKMYSMTKVLGENAIDLIALSIADTTEFGILRCIVTDTERALNALKENGFTATTTNVVAVEVSDAPNALSSVLDLLDKNGMSVEYLYSFGRAVEKKASIMFKVEDDALAERVLRENGFRILEDAELRP